MEMGFSEKKCIKALKNCDNNAERAMEWIFSHMDEPDDDDEAMNDESVAGDNNDQDQYKCQKPGQYKLQSFITHLGGSTACGHYVCHINKQIVDGEGDNKWVYFNDAKVAETNEPPVGKGYMYFFNKK